MEYFLIFLFALGTSLHALLCKRDSRSAVLWVALIWFSPIFGGIFYILFGINRISRAARLLKKTKDPEPRFFDVDTDDEILKFVDDSLQGLVKFGNKVNQNALERGNHVECYDGGDAAFPAMLKTIDSAKHSVTLSSYIFNHDITGKLFLGHLEAAIKRGIEVRVLVDATGSKYSFPTIFRQLKKRNIPCASFLPIQFPWLFSYINLRNHRKILVVDGRIGFTGGLNISDKRTKKGEGVPYQKDLHFKFEGPVVRQFQEAFQMDWGFMTKEYFEGSKWFPKLESHGEILARGILDGPDEYFERIQMTLLGALSQAKKSIRIQTPYFLPDATLKSALNVANLRGVKVEILLPEKNNIPLVKWASIPILHHLIKEGNHVYLSEPPFDHSKLLIIDSKWVLIGSTNWDPRSLRLNFEFNVECFDQTLASKLEEIFDKKMKTSKKLLLEDITNRNLFYKIRDGLARMFTPVL